VPEGIRSAVAKPATVSKKIATFRRDFTLTS
jgi:hypothetical protein